MTVQQQQSTVTDVLQNIKSFMVNADSGNLPNDNNDMLELTEIFQDDGSVVDIRSNSRRKGILEEIDNAIGELGMPKNKNKGRGADSVTNSKGQDPAPEEAKSKGKNNTVDKNTLELTPDMQEKANDTPIIIEPVGDEDNGINDLLSKDSTLEIKSMLAGIRKTRGDESGNASASSFTDIAIRELVLSSMRPMLKKWLDDNLPGLVRSIIEAEIKGLLG